jgi:hypothetical protein
MAGPVLYSTNPWFTQMVCDDYRDGRYSVWCSEIFDPASLASTDPASLIASGSSPKPIYYDVLGAVRTSDRANPKIIQYRRTFRRLARDWWSRSEISEDDRDEIVAIASAGEWRIWTPRLYVIPRQPVEDSGRLRLVPYKKRAGVGREYQISELHRSEFDMIVLEP